MTEILEAMTRPDANGTPALPKRAAPKGLLPSTWLQRTLQVSYVGADGAGVETRGTLLEYYPFGPVLSLSGEKTALSWDSVRSIVLIND